MPIQSIGWAIWSGRRAGRRRRAGRSRRAGRRGTRRSSTRIEPPPVVDAVDAADRSRSTAAGEPSLRTGLGLMTMPSWRSSRSARIACDGQPVGEQLVVGDGDGGAIVVQAGSVDAGGVTEVGVAPRFVERRPHRDPVAELVRPSARRSRRTSSAVSRLRNPPSCFECRWEIPVEQGRTRHDVVLRAAGRRGASTTRCPSAFGVAATVGHDPRPGDREAVRLQPELGHHRHVGVDPVVVVAGDVAGVAVGDLAGRVREVVPHRRATAALVDGTLDLVAGGRGSPQEPVGERESRGGRPSSGKVQQSHLLCGRGLEQVGGTCGAIELRRASWRATGSRGSGFRVSWRGGQMMSLIAPPADRTNTSSRKARCGMRWNSDRPENTPMTIAGTMTRSNSRLSQVKKRPPDVSSPSAT